MTDKLSELLSSKAVKYYPEIRSNTTRYQEQLAERRFILLISHPTHGHWNGYVPVPAASWDRIKGMIATEVYDYDGPGSERIVWKDMVSGTNRDVELFGDTIWIGQSAYGTDLGMHEMRAQIGVLESLLWSARRAHLVD